MKSFLLSVLLFTAAITANAQEISFGNDNILLASSEEFYDDVQYHKTMNSMWSINNQFTNLIVICNEVNDLNIINKKRVECINKVITELNNLTVDLKKLKLKYPDNESILLFDTVYRGHIETLKSLSNEDEWITKPKWKTIAVIMGDVLQAQKEKEN